MIDPGRREKALQQPCREALFDLVHKEPGSGAATLYARLRSMPGFEGLSVSAFRHHLAKLETFGFLGRHASGGFHAVGWVHRGVTVRPRLLEDPLATRIGRRLVEGCGHSAGALHALLASLGSADRSTVRLLLSRFESLGLVSVSGSGRARRYHATRVLVRLMGSVGDPVYSPSQGARLDPAPMRQGTARVASRSSTTSEECVT